MCMPVPTSVRRVERVTRAPVTVIRVDTARGRWREHRTASRTEQRRLVGGVRTGITLAARTASAQRR